MLRRHLFPWFPLFLILALLAPTSVVHATGPITVTTTVDEVADNGVCSLREAVLSANSNTAVGGCAAGHGPELRFVTLAGNAERSPVWSGPASGAALVNDGGTLSLTSSVITGPAGAVGCANRTGHITSGGYNVEQGISCVLHAVGDTDTDPLLGPLADNGGATQTHALLPGSPAVDRVPVAACVGIDQRGYHRPAGKRCDSGAYEVGALPPRIWLPLVAASSSNGAPSDMIAIPAGEFTRGCDDLHNAGLGGCPANEKPLMRVYLDAYRIDRTEVTNAQYRACVNAGGCAANESSHYADPHYGNHPIIGASWDEASAYCKWAGKRLPTEAEWEKAARGNSDARPFPWGENLPTCSLANFWPAYPPCSGASADTLAVGSLPQGASPYGVLDMAGNVYEWVNDWNGYYGPENRNPTGPATGFAKVVRGGSFMSGAWSVRVTNRESLPPGNARDTVGFRCAANP